MMPTDELVRKGPLHQLRIHELAMQRPKHQLFVACVRRAKIKRGVGVVRLAGHLSGAAPPVRRPNNRSNHNCNRQWQGHCQRQSHVLCGRWVGRCCGRDIRAVR